MFAQLSQFTSTLSWSTSNMFPPRCLPLTGPNFSGSISHLSLFPLIVGSRPSTSKERQACSKYLSAKIHLSSAISRHCAHTGKSKVSKTLSLEAEGRRQTSQKPSGNNVRMGAEGIEDGCLIRPGRGPGLGRTIREPCRHKHDSKTGWAMGTEEGQQTCV